MNINRPDYMFKLLSAMDIPLVKILNGVRRSGKSTLLSMFKEELIKQGKNPENIIYRRYTNLGDAAVVDAPSMYKELACLTEGKGKCYLLLDEVQEVDGWEKVVNSLYEDMGHDLYVTGSNSKLLAGEMSTYLSGRYIEIAVFPLSYREFIDFRNAYGIQGTSIMDYIRFGGFPVISTGAFDYTTAYQVVGGIYSSIVMRDIQRRHKIANMDLFNRVVDFIIENMSHTFSASSVVKFLKSQHRSLTTENIYDYIAWLEEAFVTYKCKRYDLRGRDVLQIQEKYYLSDHSLRYGIKGFQGTDVSAIIENIVYVELLRRGYSVYIGKLYDKEIDFVAQKLEPTGCIYIQVCRNMPEESDREVANLKSIKDNYTKFVITLDEYSTADIDGIRIIPLKDFLLSDI